MKVFIIILQIVSCTSINRNSNYLYKIPQKLNDGIKTSNLEKEGLDPKLFSEGIRSIITEQKNEIHSLLVMRNNKLIAEEYFYSHTANKRHDLRSATKSITSLLTGVAIDKGFIKSVNEKMYKFFPEYVSRKDWDKRKNKISIKDLLTMRVGLDWNDHNPNSHWHEDKMYGTDNWLDYFFSANYKEEPGKHFSYNTGGVFVLGEIIARAAKMSFEDFAKRYLFEPMGIENYNWSYTPQKRVDSGGHLYLTSRDMVKIGLLAINKGLWKNKRLISKNWIKESIKAQTKPNMIRQYGYLWWLEPVESGYVKSYQARGNGGQYIMIFPKIDMVVVLTGGDYNSNKQQYSFEIVKKHILMGLKNN